jgi:hypothetical protein
MLETLAGRLKWERTKNGICVEIPARLSATKEGFDSITLSIIWLWVLGVDVLRWGFERSRADVSLREFLNVADLIPFFILGWAVWVFLTSTRLSLDPDQLTMEYCVFGFRWLSRESPTRLLHNPRFTQQRYAGLQVLGSKWTALQIDSDYSTRNLAIRVTETEAGTLIAKMMEVYPFPKYLPSESAISNVRSNA